ncbi:MAG: helix-turn-helix transcriptional regulator [Oscillospiraceae bacterium]|nr:helix-turn-helix transcriptional regulator [Oscillospiraceae bacterium]
MELDYHAIGVRIRRFRKEQGLTQQTLAELSEQEPSNISHIERGATKLSLPTIVKVANALGVTVDDLLCDSLETSRAAFEREAAGLLSDCTHRELRIITGTMRSLKEQLRKTNANES